MFVMVATRIICGFSRSTTSTFIPGLNLWDFIFWANTNKKDARELLLDHFHMTSLQPHWWTTTTKCQSCWCIKTILWELNYIFTHIIPFVSWNQYGHWLCDWKRLKQNNHTLKVSRASQIISHIGKVFEGSLLAVHLPCTSGETILQDNLIRPLEVSLSQMLHLFFPPDS